MHSLVDFTIERFGALHLGVNHLGQSGRTAVSEVTEAHLMKMTHNNFFGKFWFMHSSD